MKGYTNSRPERSGPSIAYRKRDEDDSKLRFFASFCLSAYLARYSLICRLSILPLLSLSRSQTAHLLLEEEEQKPKYVLSATESKKEGERGCKRGSRDARGKDEDDEKENPLRLETLQALQPSGLCSLHSVCEPKIYAQPCFPSSFLTFAIFGQLVHSYLDPPQLESTQLTVTAVCDEYFSRASALSLTHPI